MNLAVLARPAEKIGASRSLHAFLTRLIWLCVLPLALLAGYLAYDLVQTLHAQRDQEAAHLARNFATALDRDLLARIGGLQVLAASPLADAPARWHELYREAQGFQQHFGSHVVLADLSMQMLFNTRTPFGAALPKLPRPTGHAAAPAALATGKPAVGDRFLGPIAKEALVALAAPVIREGRVQRLLLSVIETRQFQQRLEQLALPAEWSMAVLDGNGAVIARRAPPESAGQTIATQAYERHRVDSAVSHWSILLEIPQATQRAPIFAAAAALAAAIFGVTLISVLGAQLASRRLARSVAALAQTPAPPAEPAFITEIESVRGMLADAAAARAAAESSQRDSDARFEATFEQAAVGIALVAPDGQWLRVNHKLSEIVGYRPEELLALSFQDITHPDDLGSDLDYVRRMLAGEIQTYAMAKRYFRKDGAIVWINLTVALVRKPDATPDYFISVIEDIQARKQAEAEIRRLNADLERRVLARTDELTAANRELDSFAYAISHDLRAPLRAMSGFSQALAEDYRGQLPGEAQVYLDQIGLASRNMSALIDGLLALSRSTRGELRYDAVDLSVLAQHLLAELAQSEPERQVAVQVAAGLQAHGDARMLEAVLRNLLGNAWKYTARAATPCIRFYREERTGLAFFCVADNGAGFDMAHANRLFQPFQRLHRQDEFPGIGIGLATVQRIVHRHGGTIEARGEPGKGATFCFSLAQREDGENQA